MTILAKIKYDMIAFRRLFGDVKCAVLGMVHVGALPGTPKHCYSMNELVEKACTEAQTYAKYGVDGIIVENMHDIPYIKATNMGPEVTSCMTRICTEIKKVIPTKMPCGVQVLAAANYQAIAVAMAAGLDFIRAEGFVFSHVADEGFIDGCAGDLLRYRHRIGVDQILVFADIKKKHSSHSITDDVSIAETAQAASFFAADGLIVTGSATGQQTCLKDLTSVKLATDLPVFVGSGVTPDNLGEYVSTADAVIVGSYFKKHGIWTNPIDCSRLDKFMTLAKTV